MKSNKEVLEQMLSNPDDRTELDLMHNVTASDMAILVEVLSNCPSLLSLHSIWSAIDKEGAELLAKALHRNCTLTLLNLQGNDIGKEGAGHLATVLSSNYSALTSINLGASNIDNEGAQYLAKALRNNRTLISMDLERNQIGKEGIEHLAAAFGHNRTLTALQLEGNPIGSECALLLQNIKTNLLRNQHQRHHWAGISFFLSFMRATEGHPFQNSCFTLVPEVVKLIP